ncbi:hypothetical protein HMPREF9098_0706 [Kingella denitrificans ATCC 33394]|uniref:Uncharacterized protein n=1 Tax=Kingella denitrificans ATCC 33394 TaxID=888741 RepID=F0EXZ6_9NEIS|nr:hypothetical protein HMPREF9098_0706 [Kingella denitrificans ATCC 33394]
MSIKVQAAFVARKPRTGRFSTAVPFLMGIAILNAISYGSCLVQTAYCRSYSVVD